MNGGKLFELLLENDDQDIINFIMENGKSPKVINPIRITNDDERKELKNGKE